MHLSMHNWMRAEPIKVTIARLAKYGYKSIEISGEPEQFGQNGSKDTKKLLDDHGLKCWGSVTLMLGERNLVAADSGQRAKSVQYTKDCITMVKELDGYEMTIVPATVGKIVADATADEEWKWAVESMKEIYEHSEKAGVRLAIEPLNRFETYFINRAEQAMALAEATGPNCGVCLDAFHINIEEADLYEAIRSTKGRLTDFHVADNNRMPAGHGDYDWKKVISTLKSIGYDGALTAEFVAPIDRTPANHYKNALETNFDNVDISPEQLKFIIDHGSNILTESFYDWLVEENAKHLLPLI
ncbi:sugar phosphate isomerase [Candidatus Planktophila limnetica]|uniref:Sugar phosphate isomerase n=1 Tax=Candidatus Planktophila limnetica TaxID=573600 RepID=A0A249LFW1_9ACTN|nr:sugar phosphate isomerase/epimerase family protein [Candidatus Planktophila limnetica]ASY27982.1 sugar phosphate isomerase [Candidatus Planktophila limnetica]MCX6445629.1 sugar phosphate isomerase/epimerase [Actinomycetota bacterium]